MEKAMRAFYLETLGGSDSLEKTIVAPWPGSVFWAGEFGAGSVLASKWVPLVNVGLRGRGPTIQNLPPLLSTLKKFVMRLI